MAANALDNSSYNPDMQYTAVKAMWTICSQILKKKKVKKKPILFALRGLAQCAVGSMEKGLGNILGIESIVEYGLTKLASEASKHKYGFDQSVEKKFNAMAE